MQDFVWMNQKFLPKEKTNLNSDLLHREIGGRILDFLNFCHSESSYLAIARDYRGEEEGEGGGERKSFILKI